MTIKLLRAKKDLHWEDKIYGEKPFCTKDTWYEVTGDSDGEVCFKNDNGDDHYYPYQDINKHFWTIDFEEGFEFLNSTKKKIIVKNGDFKNTACNFESVADIEYFIKSILCESYEVIRYSNQKETQTKKVKPSKEDRPYENWKMSISKDKFIRCIEPEEMVFETVEGLVGWLNKDTNMFYYKVKSKQYLSAKVYPFSYPDSTIGYEFVKENKDAEGYRPKSKPVTEDKYEFCPENIWGNFHWKDTPVAESSGDYDNPSILDVVESTRKGILASFNEPNRLTEESHDEYWQRIKSSGGINASLGKETNYTLAQEAIENGTVGIKSDGGKSDYYKIELPEWLLQKQYENGFIMLEDLAEVLFENDFNFTNVFKAQKRMFELKKGRGKAGNDFEYDAKKCKYYVDKQVEVEGREC